MRTSFFKTFLFLLVLGCKTSKFPVEPLPAPDTVKVSYEIENEGLRIEFKNFLRAPVLAGFTTSDKGMNDSLKKYSPLVLPPERDTVLYISGIKERPELNFTTHLGDPGKQVNLSPVALPVPKNQMIRIVQGHNGSYSHNKKYNRYAIDFRLKINDTVFAASEGYVIRAVDGYKLGGKDIRFLDFANSLIIYNPKTGLFFQYSHLAYKGVFFQQGDWVNQGQPIGLAGMTGYTDIPHLHFNVSAPDPSNAGLVSVPVDFIEGFRGKDLQKNVHFQRPL